jgi:ketosteroid isomerase-like protein
MFHTIIKRQARRTFDRVNTHDYDGILQGALPGIRHRFAGEHALGGERNDVAHMRLWFERLGRVVPTLTLTVTDVWVTGGLSKAVVIVRWDANATLLDGSPYRNHGVHIIHLRRLKIVSIDVSEDSQAVARCMERQAEAGIAEALAAPIVS